MENGWWIFSDLNLYELITSQRLIPVPIGTPSISQSQSFQLASPFMLDHYSANLLMELDVLPFSIKEEVISQQNKHIKTQNEDSGFTQLNSQFDNMNLNESKYLVFKHLHQTWSKIVINLTNDLWIKS